MPTATLTSKGQVTVPKPVRQALGLRTGDRLLFRVRDDGVVVIEVEGADILALRGVIKPKVRGVSVEDMNRAIALAAAGR
ncbi:MAG: type II toxin-antitoxin system PrlF family antitoxin [Deltaproteobacteria bacterium]|nr:type II toxin-antitoxin system PrlF family antitoxin [Deltaproteobacteria bacterium]